MTSGSGATPGPLLPRVVTGFVRDPFRFLEDCVARYGDFYRLPVGRGILVVNDPDHIAEWLTDYDRFTKGEMSRAIEPALGDGIPISDGEKWRRNRKAMNPMFGRRNLDALSEILASSLARSMERWDEIAESGAVVDLYREVSILTMQALQRSLFSSSVSDSDVPSLVDAFDRLRRWMGGLMLTYWLPNDVPAPGQRKGREARARITERIRSVVAERRSQPTETGDLLNLLLATTYDDGSMMSDDELFDELMGLWFGGYDTTGSALAWTLALLAENPEAAEALHAEADAYVGDFGGFVDLEAMDWAKACFDEGQRFQGALLLTRDAVTDCDVAGHPVAAGSMVAFSAYTLNRNPEYWRNPGRYDPARFVGDRGRDRHPYQFRMFGGGPRHCIGVNLAYLEAQFALTMIAQRFHVQPVPGYVPRHDFHLSVGLKGGLPATIRRRTTGRFAS